MQDTPVPSRTGCDLLKRKVNEVLDHPQMGDSRAIAIQAFLAATIVINTIAVIIITIPDIRPLYFTFLNLIITICLGIFAIEYFLRLWSCTVADTLQKRTFERLKYALHFYLIIDLVSIIPIFFPFLFPSHIALLRLVRLVSIFKLGRYTRYSKSLALFRRVLIRKQEIFAIMLFFLVFVILFSSTMLYLVENPVQPDSFSSIPAAMWWAVMTVTTVGYGDIIPVTPLGRILAGLFTLVGVLVLALPSAILASGFMEEREKEREQFAFLEKKSILEKITRLYEEGKIDREDFNEFRDLLGNNGEITPTRQSRPK
jgi:voltage-gated potassium channel